MKDKDQTVSLRFFGIPRLLPYLYPYRGRITRMVLLALICSVIDVSYPLFNRYVLDHFIAEGTLQGLPAFIVLYVAVLLFQAVINDRTMIDSGTVEMSVDRDLRNKAFHHIQTLSFSYFNQNSVGYIHARVMSDTGKIGEAVSWRMMDCIWNGSYILFAIFVMCRTDLQLALPGSREISMRGSPAPDPSSSSAWKRKCRGSLRRTRRPYEKSLSAQCAILQC